METLLQGNSHIFDEDSGQFISAAHQRIAEIIAEFDPTLRLMWIPPARRNPGEKPFAVGQIRENLPAPYVFMYLDESELDHRLIGKLFRMRQLATGKPGSLEQAMLDAEAVVEAKKAVERAEAAEEAADRARFLWKTPLHTVRMDGKVFRL